MNYVAALITLIALETKRAVGRAFLSSSVIVDILIWDALLFVLPVDAFGHEVAGTPLTEGCSESAA